MGKQKQNLRGNHNIQVGRNLIIISSISLLSFLLLLLLPLPAIYEASGLKYAVERFRAAQTVREHLDQNQLDAAKTLLDRYLPIYPENAELHVQQVRYLMMSRELIWDFRNFRDVNWTTRNEVFKHSQSAIQLDNSLKSYVAEVLAENSVAALEAEANQSYPVTLADLPFVTEDFFEKRLPCTGIFECMPLDKSYYENSGFAGFSWVYYIELASEYDLATSRRFVPRLDKLVDKFLKDGHFTSATFVGFMATKLDSNKDTQAMFDKGLKVLQQVVEHTQTNPKRVNAARKAYEAFSQSWGEADLDLKQFEGNQKLVALERQLLEVALTTLNLSQNIRETEEYKQCVRQLQLSSVGTKFTSLVKQSIEDSLGSSFLNKAKQLASAGKLEQAIKETRWIPDGTQANNDASRLTEEWSNTLREQAEARQRAEARQAVRAERLQLEGRMRATQQERAQLENLIIELKQRIRTSQWKQQYQVQQELESQLKPLIQQLKTLLAEQKNLQQQLYEQIAREKNLEEQLE